jgi:hypothetical protein
MHDSTLFSNLDTLLVAVPFLIFLVIGYFRLDEVFVSPSQRESKAKAHRIYCGVDNDGQVMLSDPDGRPWSTVRSSHLN